MIFQNVFRFLICDRDIQNQHLGTSHLLYYDGFYLNYIIDHHRFFKVQYLAEVECPRTGKLHANNRGYERRGQHSVDHPFLESGFRSKTGIHM